MATGKYYQIEDLIRRMDIAQDYSYEQYKKAEEDGSLEPSHSLGITKKQKKAYNQFSDYVKVPELNSRLRFLLPEYSQSDDIFRGIHVLGYRNPVKEFTREKTPYDSLLIGKDRSQGIQDSVYDNMISKLLKFHNTGAELQASTVSIDKMSIPRLLKQNPSTRTTASESLKDVTDIMNGKYKDIRSYDLETFGDNTIWQYGYADLNEPGIAHNKILAPTESLLDQLKKLRDKKGGMTPSELVSYHAIQQIGHAYSTGNLDMKNSEVKTLEEGNFAFTDEDFDNGVKALREMRQTQMQGSENLSFTLGQRTVTRTITQEEKRFTDFLYDTFASGNKLVVGTNNLTFDLPTIQRTLAQRPELVAYLRQQHPELQNMSIDDLLSKSKQVDVLNWMRSLNPSSVRYLEDWMKKNSPNTTKAFSRAGATSFQLETMKDMILGDIGASHHAGIDARGVLDIFFNPDATVTNEKFKNNAILDVIQSGLQKTTDGDTTPISTVIQFANDTNPGSTLFSYNSGYRAGQGLLFSVEDNISNQITFSNGLEITAGQDTPYVSSQYTRNTNSAGIGKYRTYEALGLQKINIWDLPESVQESLGQVFQGQTGRYLSDQIYALQLGTKTGGGANSFRYGKQVVTAYGTLDNIKHFLGTTMHVMNPVDDMEKQADTLYQMMKEKKDGMAWLESNGLLEPGKNETTGDFYKRFIDTLETSSAERVLEDRATRSFSDASESKVNRILDINNEFQKLLQTSGIDMKSETGKKSADQLMDVMFQSALQTSQNVAQGNANSIKDQYQYLTIEQIEKAQAEGRNLARSKFGLYDQKGVQKGFMSPYYIDNLHRQMQWGPGFVQFNQTIKEVMDTLDKELPSTTPKSTRNRLVSDIQKQLLRNISYHTGETGQERVLSLSDLDTYRINTRGQFGRTQNLDFISVHDSSRFSPYSLINTITEHTYGMKRTDPQEQLSAMRSFILDSPDPALQNLRNRLRNNDKELNNIVSAKEFANLIGDAIHSYREKNGIQEDYPTRISIPKILQSVLPDDTEFWTGQKETLLQAAREQVSHIIPTQDTPQRMDKLADLFIENEKSVKDKIDELYAGTTAGDKVFQLHKTAVSEWKMLMRNLAYAVQSSNMSLEINKDLGIVNLVDQSGHTTDISRLIPHIQFKGGVDTIVLGGTQYINIGHIDVMGQNTIATSSIGHAILNTRGLRKRFEQDTARTKGDIIYGFMNDISRTLHQETVNVNRSMQDAKGNLTVNLSGLIPHLQEIVQSGNYSSELKTAFNPATPEGQKSLEYELKNGELSESRRVLTIRELPDILRQTLGNSVQMPYEDLEPGTDKSESTSAILRNAVSENRQELGKTFARGVNISGKSSQIREWKFFYDDTLNNGFDLFQGPGRGAANVTVRSFAFDADRFSSFLSDVNRTLGVQSNMDIDVGKAILTEYGDQFQNNRKLEGYEDGRRFSSNVSFQTQISDEKALLDGQNLEKMISDRLSSENPPEALTGKTKEYIQNAIDAFRINAGTMENSGTIDARIVDAINRQQDVQSKRITNKFMVNSENEKEIIKQINKMERQLLPVITVDENGHINIKQSNGMYHEIGDVLYAQEGLHGQAVSVKVKHEGISRIGFFNEAGVRANESDVAQWINSSLSEDDIALLKKDPSQADRIVGQKILGVSSPFEMRIYHQNADQNAFIKMARNYSEKHETSVLYGRLGAIDSSIAKELDELGLSGLKGRILSVELFQDLAEGRMNPLFHKYIKDTKHKSVDYNYLKKHISNPDEWKEKLTAERYAPSLIMDVATGGSYAIVSSYEVKHSDVSSVLQSVLQELRKSDINGYHTFASKIGLTEKDGQFYIPQGIKDIDYKIISDAIEGTSPELRERLQNIMGAGKRGTEYTARSSFNMMFGAYENGAAGGMDSDMGDLEKGAAFSDRETTKLAIPRYDKDFVERASALYSSPEEYRKIYGSVLDEYGRFNEAYDGKSIMSHYINDLGDQVYNTPDERRRFAASWRQEGKYKTLRQALKSKKDSRDIDYEHMSLRDLEDNKDLITSVSFTDQEKKTAELLKKQYGANNVNVSAVREVTLQTMATESARANMAQSESSYNNLQKTYGFERKNIADLDYISNEADLSATSSSLFQRGQIIDFTNDRLGLTDKTLEDLGAKKTIAVQQQNPKIFASDVMAQKSYNKVMGIRKKVMELSQTVDQEGGVDYSSDAQNAIRKNIALSIQDLDSMVQAEGSGKSMIIAPRRNIRFAYSARPSINVLSDEIYNADHPLTRNISYRGLSLPEYIKRSNAKLGGKVKIQPDMVFVGQDTLEQMGLITNKMSEEEVTRRLNILEHQGITGFTNRSPSMYRGSVLPVHIYYNKHIVNGQMQMSSLTAAKMKGDSDGDKAALIATQVMGQNGQVFTELDDMSQMDAATRNELKSRLNYMTQAEDFQQMIFNPQFQNYKTIQKQIIDKIPEWSNTQFSKYADQLAAQISAKPEMWHAVDLKMPTNKERTAARDAFVRTANTAWKDEGFRLNAANAGITSLDELQSGMPEMLKDDNKGLFQQFASFATETDADKIQKHADYTRQMADITSKVRQSYAGYVDRPLYALQRMYMLADQNIKTNNNFQIGLTALQEGFLSPKNNLDLHINAVQSFSDIYQDMIYHTDDSDWETRLKDWAQKHVNKIQGTESAFFHDNQDLLRTKYNLAEKDIGTTAFITARKDIIMDDVISTIHDIMDNGQNVKDIVRFDKFLTKSTGISNIRAFDEGLMSAGRNDRIKDTITGRLVHDTAVNMEYQQTGEIQEDNIRPMMKEIERRERSAQEKFADTSDIPLHILKGRTASSSIPDRVVETARNVLGGKKWYRGAGAIVGGLMAAGYIGGNPSQVPQQPTPKRLPQGTNIQEMPDFSDTSLNTMRQGPANGGYIININAQSREGQDAAQNAIIQATQNSFNQTDVNIAMNVHADNTISQQDVTNYIQSALA